MQGLCVGTAAGAEQAVCAAAEGAGSGRAVAVRGYIGSLGMRTLDQWRANRWNAGRPDWQAWVRLGTAVCSVAGPHSRSQDGSRPVFTSLKVAGYRGLKSLEVKRLGQVNLVAGRNNSGKTSLLEAVFLLAHGGSAQAAINGNVVRGGVSTGAHPDENSRALWGPMFSDLDLSQPVSISGKHSVLGALDLKITHRYSGRFERASASRDTHPGAHASFGEDGAKVEVKGDPLVAPCVILKSSADNPQDDAKRLGLLRVRKQASLVVEALQVIEPRLQALDGFAGPGGHTLWGDIGRPEQIPLAVLGDGVNRLARLVLAMAHKRGLVVLVDEIENGFHHSVLERVWKAIHTTAERFATQVIATTHSHEAIAAAYRASPGHDFVLHRLDVDDDAVKCVTYDSESIEGALEHGLEVR